MKLKSQLRHIFGIALVIGAASASSQAATIFTTGNSATATVNNAWYNGFRLNLDDTLASQRLSTSSDTAGVAMSDFTTVKLDSVTTNIRSNTGTGNGANPGGNVYLAVTNSAGTVLNMSTNFVTASGDQTWNFSDTSISTTENLYFVFTKSTYTAGHTLLASDMVSAGGGTMIQYGNQSGLSSLNFLGNNTAPSMNDNNQNYGPKLTLKTSVDAVPEPSTATLGLVALAGLLARRRRRA